MVCFLKISVYFYRIVIIQPAKKMIKKKKVAPAPAGMKKAVVAKKETNPLFEKRPRNFAIGMYFNHG